jgi:hypothetical protein
LYLNEQHQIKLLAECGITSAESALLNAIHYGILVRQADLPRYATGDVYCLGKPGTLDEGQRALASCFARGWLRVVDDAVLAEIVSELKREQFLGPIYRLPPVGAVDFTPSGARFWQQLSRGLQTRVCPPFAFTDVVHMRTDHYFPTRATALAHIAEVSTWDETVAVEPPELIGPWRVQWWRRFSEGYRIRIEERCKWQGRCGGDEGWHWLRPLDWATNRAQLRHILDCHNVDLAEWVVLASLDSYCPTYPLHLIKFIKKIFDITLSEEECRAALDVCLNHGWARTVDRDTWLEIQALMQDEPALMPLHRGLDSKEIDFTPTGAALYQMIAAEYFGSGWDSHLAVWKETYREEHRYCETEEGFRNSAEEYLDPWRVVRARRVVPIGPWCVYWWERFPSGYRLELEIEER